MTQADKAVEITETPAVAGSSSVKNKTHGKPFVTDGTTYNLVLNDIKSVTSVKITLKITTSVYFQCNFNLPSLRKSSHERMCHQRSQKTIE